MSKKYEKHYQRECENVNSFPESFFNRIKIKLTLAGKVTNSLSTSIFLKMAERSEAKSAKRSFATKYLDFYF